MKKVVILIFVFLLSLGVFHTDVSASRRPVKTYKWKNGKLVEVKNKNNKKTVKTKKTLKPKKTSKYKPFHLPKQLAINERVEVVTYNTLGGTDKSYTEYENDALYRIEFKGDMAKHIEDLGRDWDGRTEKVYYYFLSKKAGKVKYDVYDRYNNYVNSGETEFVDMKRFEYKWVQLEDGRVIIAITNNSGEDFIKAEFGFDVYKDKRLNSRIPYRKDHYRLDVMHTIIAFVRGTTRHIELRGNGHDDGTESYNMYGKFPYYFEKVKKIEAFLNNNTNKSDPRGVDVTGRASLIAVDGHYEDILDPELNSTKFIPSVLIAEDIKGVFKTNSPSSYADRLNLYVKATSEKDIGNSILEIAYFDNKDRCIGVYWDTPHSWTYDEKTGKHSKMSAYNTILKPSSHSPILEMTEKVNWNNVAYAKLQYSSVTFEEVIDMGAKDMRQFFKDKGIFYQTKYTGKYKGQTFSD